MNTAAVLLYCSIGFAAVAIAAVVIGWVAQHRQRLMLPVAIAAVTGSCACFTIGLDAIEDDFETTVVAAVETKYDVEVTGSSRGGGPEDLRTWTIDGTDRECFLDGMPSPTDFEGYTDPVLRCAAPIDVTFPELGSDD